MNNLSRNYVYMHAFIVRPPLFASIEVATLQRRGPATRWNCAPRGGWPRCPSETLTSRNAEAVGR